jgi:hypothetical protein
MKIDRTSRWSDQELPGDQVDCGAPLAGDAMPLVWIEGNPLKSVKVEHGKELRRFHPGITYAIGQFKPARLVLECSGECPSFAYFKLPALAGRVLTG